MFEFVACLSTTNRNGSRPNGLPPASRSMPSTGPTEGIDPPKCHGYADCHSAVVARVLTTLTVATCSAVLGADLDPERQRGSQRQVVHPGHLANRSVTALAHPAAQRLTAPLELVTRRGRHDDQHVGVEFAVPLRHRPFRPVQGVHLADVLDPDVTVPFGRRGRVVPAADRAPRVT